MSSAAAKALSVVETPKEKLESQAKIPRLNERLTEELVIALVGPVGSGCSTAYEQLKIILKNDYSYEVHYCKLSDYIAQGAKLVDATVQNDLTVADKIEQLQAIGDKLRQVCGMSYLAAKAVEQIAERRDLEGFGKTADGQSVPKKIRQVHVIDSIKHPEELKLLRATYGEIFWLIGVFAPMNVREQRLSSQVQLDKAAIGAIVQRDYTPEFDTNTAK